LARAIPGFLRDQRDGLGVSGVPILIMGDLNSYWQRQPRGAQWILGKHGFRDAYTAKKRINPEVPTINVTSTRRNPFPAKPFRFDKPARLDYVLFDRGKARRYEVHVRLKGGRFDNRYRSSDHNLVRATLRLPSVTG
jgi:endonuclease/exonuclease/phosphatase family metal-dependent hydrolase